MKRFLSFFKVFKNIRLDLLIVFIISSISLYAVLLHIDILGLKYLIPIAIVLLILCIVNSLIIVSKRVKSKIKTVITVLFSLLSFIFIAASIILLNTFSSVKDMFSAKSYIEYSVMVNKSSEYKKIEDIDNKIIGFYQEDKYHEEAENKLNKKISAQYIGYSTIEELEYALINEDIDALMIIDSYLDILSNDEDVEIENIEDEEITEITNQNILDKIKDFDTKTRTIYKFKIDIDNSSNNKKIDLDEGSFAVFVSGQDSFNSSVTDASRSDVNMLMTVNLKTKQILLLSIPRDYYINISGKGANDKLTHISIYGAETAANSIGDMLDVEVEYFVKFNFTTFMKAIEYILPLDVYSDYDFTTDVYDQTIGNSYTFSKGYNHITSGEMALQFVRARKNFSEGDRQRGINQSRMLRAVINKASTPQVLLKYNDILKALDGTFLTNISDESIMQIIKYVINNNGKFNISSFSLDGYDATRTCYSSGSTPLYVMIPNSVSVEQASIYIKDVLEGRVPDIATDASEYGDPNNSASVNKTTYEDRYGHYYGGSSNNNNNSVNQKNDDNKVTTKDDDNNTENNDDENNQANPDVVVPDDNGNGTDQDENTGEGDSDNSKSDDDNSDNNQDTPNENPEQGNTIE